MRNPLDWSRKTKAIVAVVLALVLWLPQGVSTEQQTVVTGHSTFYNADVYDKCLASVAGILRSRVMWFNDMVLAERYGGKGTFVYITEQGAPDPTKEEFLISEGVFFDFVDPNGAHWHVEEAYMDYGGSATYPGPNNANEWAGEVITNIDDPPVEPKRFHVWFVELSDRPIYDEFNDHTSVNDPNFHTFYNFLVLVDTCKFNNNTQTYRTGGVNHTGLEPGHESSADDHWHGGWNANVWVGTRPVVLAGKPADNAAEWQTQWATTGGPQRDAQRVPNGTDDRLPG